MEELLCTFDKHGNYLGDESREYCHSKKFKNYFKVAYVWVVSEDNQILIQQRAAIKKVDPLRWDSSVGGHVDAGETSLSTAKRETFEELGITAKESEFKFLKQFRSKYFHSFTDIYLLKVKSSDISLVIQPSEVIATKWVTNQELRQIIFTKQFCTHIRKYKKWVIKTIGKAVVNEL